MSFTEAIKHCLSKYATFKGRATRSEYWYFVLFSLIVYVLTILFSYELYVVAVVGLIIPTLSAAVRRLHDGGRSGWNFLWSLIPFGSIVILIWLTRPSEVGTNKYDL